MGIPWFDYGSNITAGVFESIVKNGTSNPPSAIFQDPLLTV